MSIISGISTGQTNFNLTLPNYSALISDQFHVVHKFNVTGIMDVNVFLFATHHESDECSEVVGTALSQIARHHDHIVIFVEGISKTGELIEQKEFLMEYLDIDPSLSGKVHFFSWDLKTEEGYRLFTNNLDEEIDRLTEALKTLEKTYSEVVGELKVSYPELWDAEIQREYSSDERGELNYLMNIHRALVEKKAETANKLKETVAMANEMERKTFPHRTASMVSALQSIENLPIQVKGTTAVAFVGGTSHLCQKECADQVYDLSPLYHELSHHRAMVLLPKDL